MSSTPRSDPLVVETTINGLCRSPELENTIELRHETNGPSKAHGKGMTIILEGHDISHMVTEFSFNSSSTDATRVTIDLVGLRPI